MNPPKRKVDTVVLSDIHLGTYGCHAKELLRYLKTIDAKTIVLNGDIIDIWQFNKRYWPQSHMHVVKHFTGLIAQGVKVHYITGNHDEMLRKFVGFKMGSFEISNKLILKQDGQTSWIFHGDVFDVTMKHSKWLAKLGAIGYDILILINRFVNFISEKLGRGKISLSQRVKNEVKSAISFINDFEQTAADIAIDKGYDNVICGHIHQPTTKKMENESGSCMYLNSGDWIENLTALEYNHGKWTLYKYQEDAVVREIDLSQYHLEVQKNKDLFEGLLTEFKLLAS